MVLLPYKVAVLMQAGGPMGGEIAQKLAEEGARIVVSAATAPQLEMVLEGLHVRGATAMGIVGDPADPAFARRLLAEASAKWGRVDALVNLAVAAHSRPFAALDTAAWDAALCDVHAVFVASREAFAAFQGSGSIVNVLGRTDATPPGMTEADERGHFAHLLARGALRGLTEVMHAEGQAAGIRANAVLLAQDDHAPAHARAAQTVVWLASERASHVSGMLLEI